MGRSIQTTQRKVYPSSSPGPFSSDLLVSLPRVSGPAGSNFRPDLDRVYARPSSTFRTTLIVRHTSSTLTIIPSFPTFSVLCPSVVGVPTLRTSLTPKYVYRRGDRFFVSSRNEGLVSTGLEAEENRSDRRGPSVTVEPVGRSSSFSCLRSRCVFVPNK